MGDRVIIIHGLGSNSQEHWFGAAKEALEESGYEVSVPDMPDSDLPVKEKWVQVIRAHSPNKHTVLIGHSLGGTTILRYLESIEQPIHTCMLIASPIRSTGDSAINNFFIPDFDWRKIRAMAGRFLLLYQEADPAVPIEHGKELARYLGVSLMMSDGDDHFDRLDIGWLLATITS